MAGRTLINIESPVTQSVAAIKALLQWKGRSSDPLPQFVELGKEESRLILVLSNKRDAYYTTTARQCSCPARGWHPNQPCKHQRKYFAEVKAATKPTAGDSIRPNTKAFRPFDTLPGEEKARASSSYHVVDTLQDTNARDIAYFSIQNDREMWPAEA